MTTLTNIKSYGELVTKLKYITHLRSIGNFLGWDEQVNLPKNSAQVRAEEKAAITQAAHEAFATKEVGQLIQELESMPASELTAGQQAVVRETRRDYDRAVKLPLEFLARKQIATSNGYHAWVDARKNNDFKSYAPYLKENVALCLEEADYIGCAGDSYDYLIDQFDPGMDAKTVDILFTELKAELLPIVQKILESSVKPDISILKDFSVDKQDEFLRKVTKKLGFDYDRGRMDTAIHPFCGGSPGDCRLTTRFHKNAPLDSLFSSIHEAGHGLYQQGLLAEHYGTPLGEPIGMGVHESQSRLWENQVGRSRAFWKHWEFQYREQFPEQLESISFEELYLVVNAVTKNPIRVDSDEVTYNLHVILRFTLEKMLMEGSLEVEDLPEVWNKLSDEIVGITPKNDIEGVLQDVHWSCALFGYFPSYCLGNMLSAQLWFKVRGEIPSLDDDIESGNFEPLLNWLRINIHQHGKLYSMPEITQKVTGEALSPKYLIQYLSERYLPLYS